MATEDAGFFRFDTNLGEVVTDIEAGMARINRALSDAGKPTLGAGLDTQALGSTLDRMESDLQSHVAKVRDLMGQVTSGALDPREFKDRIRGTIREAIGGIGPAMAEGIGSMPASVARSLPATEVSTTLGRNMVRSLVDTVKAGGAEVQAAMAGLTVGNFNFDLNRLGKNPVAYGQEQTREAFLANQARIEQLAKLNETGRLDTQNIDPHLLRTVQAYQDQASLTTESGKLPGTNTKQEIADINAATRAREAEEKATEKEIKAEEDLQEAIARRMNREADAAARAKNAADNEQEAIARRINREADSAESEKEAIARRINREKDQADKDQEAVARRINREKDQADNEQEAIARRINSEQDRISNERTRTANAEEDAAFRRNKALTEESNAIGAIFDGYQKVNGLLVPNETATAYRQTPHGITTEGVNPIREKEALDAVERINAAQANSVRLMERWSEVIPVGQYAVLGDEVFKINQGLAYAVQEGLEYQKVMDRVALQQERANLRATKGQGGILDGFFGNLSKGGSTNLAYNIGSHVGSALQFTAGYGALFAIQGALRDTVTQYKEYQLALTDLQVATRDTGAVTDEWVNSLSDVARVTGENVGAALETAARGVRAFGDPLHQSVQDLQDIGSAANDAANKLAKIADKSLTDATGDLIAVGTSYQMQPDQLGQVTDAISNAKRNLGGDPKEISQGLASIAASAGTAGFGLQQAADLISLVQGRVDESGQAAATRLTRIFQTTSGTTGKALGAELGVDTNQSVRKQLEEYAALYNDASTSKAVKDRITSQLGGTANLRELLALLQNIHRLTQADQNAMPGAANSEWNRKAESLAGTLTKIQGDMKAIMVDIGRTDLGAPFALAVRTLEPLLHLLDRLMQYFDELPTAIKLPLGLLADVAIAAKSIAAVQNARAAAAAKNAATAVSTDTAAALATAQTNAAAATEAEAAAASEVAAAEGALVIALQDLMAGSTTSAAGAIDATNAFTAALAEGTATTAEMSAAEVAAAYQIQELMAGATVSASDAAAASALYTEALAAAAEATAANATAQAELAAASEAVAAETAGKGFMDGLKSLGGLLVNPYVLGAGAVIGAGVLINKGFDAHDQIAGFNSQAAGTSSVFGRIDGSSASLASAAHDLRATAGEISHSQSNMWSANAQTQIATSLRAQATQLATLQSRVAREDAASAAANKGSSVFGDGGVVTTVSELSTGLDALAQAGYTATQQMRALEGALYDTASPKGGQRYAPEGYSSDVSGKVYSDLKKAIGKDGITLLQRTSTVLPDGGTVYNVDKVKKDAKEAYNLLTSANSQVKIADAVKARAQELGLHKGDVLTTADKKQLAEAAVNALNLDQVSLASDRKRIHDELLKLVKDGLAGTGADKAQSLLNGKGGLSRGQIISLLNPSADGTWKGLIAQQQAAIQAIPASDDGTQLMAVQKRYVRLLNDLVKRGQVGGAGDIGILMLEVNNAKAALAESTVAQMEELRRNAQNQKGLSRKAIRQIGRNYLQQEIIAAGADTKLLIQIMNNADQASLDIVEAHLKRLAAIAAASETSPSARNLNDIANRGGPSMPQQSEAGKNLNAFQDAKGQAAPTKDPFGGLYAGGTDGPDYKAPKSPKSSSSGQSPAEKHAALVAAQADAAAAHTGGSLASARAQIIGATAQLNAAKKGTVEWYQALASLYNAQSAMRDAVVQYQNNLDLLHGDSTDPVEQAADALRASTRKLRSDLRAHQGKDVIAADRADVQDKRNAYLSTKFNQHFSDMQTREQLGQIDFNQWMQYLDNQHDRLSKIHHRTRQQQDELNQVDEAIKSAVSGMEGQFNLGSIDTNGLVYSARQYAAEQKAKIHQSALQNAQADLRTAVTNQHSVTIHVNGADVQKVRRIIDEYVGKPGRVTTPSPRRH